MQDVNTKGVFLCCKHGIPHLLERGGGSVINVASFVAILGAATSQISYTASKGAVLALSRELGVQFARRGRARERALSRPGRDAAAARIYGDDPAALERRRVHWPTGRLGSRARSSTPRSSWRATSRRSSPARRSSSTAASRPPTSRRSSRRSRMRLRAENVTGRANKFGSNPKPEAMTTCIRCGKDEAHEATAYCAPCAMHARRSASGMRRLGEYLAAWAAFDDWLRARGTGPAAV